MFNYSREKQLRLVKKNPDNIVLIKNLHDDTLEYIATNYPLYIESDHKLTEKMMICAVSKNPRCFRYISNPTDNAIRFALELDSTNLEFVKNKTPEFIKISLRSGGTNMKFVDNQTEEYQKIVIFNRFMGIKYIKKIHPNLVKYASVWATKCYKKELHFEIKELIEHDISNSFYIKGLPISLILLAQEDTKIRLTFEEFDCEFIYQ